MTNSYDLSVGDKRLEKVEASPIRTILDRAAVLRGEGKPVIPFSAGEPDFNTPTDIKEATIRAITNNQTKYTSNRGYPALRKVLKDYIQRETGIAYDPETEILVTSSAAEALNNTIMTFVDEGDEVIVLTPAFISYKCLVNMCGAKYIDIPMDPEKGFQVDMDALRAAITDKTNVMMSSVSGDERGIGYISLGSLNDSVKAVSVEGVAPSVATVKDGSYKLARPFNVAYKADNSKDTLADFLRYLASAQAQTVIGEEGYVSVKEGAADYVAPATAPTSKIVVGGSSSVSPLMEVLIEDYCRLSGVAIEKIELQTLDSTAGMTNAASGTYDLGMASRALKDSEAAQLESFVLAQDGIAVIVNNANETDNLTIEQIRQIFTGEVRNWANIA